MMSEKDLVQQGLPRWIEIHVDKPLDLNWTTCKLQFCLRASRCHHEQSKSIKQVSKYHSCWEISDKTSINNSAGNTSAMSCSSTNIVTLPISNCSSIN